MYLGPEHSNTKSKFKESLPTQLSVVDMLLPVFRGNTSIGLLWVSVMRVLVAVSGF